MARSRTRRALVLGAGTLAAVGLMLVLSSQRGAPWDDAAHREPEAADEVPELADPSTIAAALALARIRLAGGDPDPSVLQGVPGRRLWLCGYRALPHPVCASGAGDDLGRAVLAAAADLDERIPPGRLSETLLKVDVVLSSAPSTWPSDARPHDAGAYGIVVGGAAILPSEVLQAELYATDDEDDPAVWHTDALRRLLGLRGAQVEETFPFERVRTAAWVEAAPAGPVTRLYRVHAFDRPDASDPDEVLAAAIMAAEHLAGTVSADGRIRYKLDVQTGREGRGYNLLRHGGTTYSLLQAYARSGHEPWLVAARKALGFLLSKSARDTRTGPYGGGDVQYVVEGSHIKLGGAGLALVALATFQGVSGDASLLDEARAYARFLVSQQQQDGEFVYFAPREVGGTPRDDTSAYYPGEAILGLILLHDLDPDPLWLETAVRGADWLIDVRDRGLGSRQLSNDHWLMIALSHLYAATRDERYLDHSLRLAEAVRVQAERQAGHEAFHRDYLGGFYEPPRSTPAATRAEGLVAVLDTCALAGRDCTEVRELLGATVSHMLQSQYTPALLYWLPAPGTVVGGFAGGIVDPDLRNDYTQHALSALLGTERHLRPPAGPLEPAVLDVLRAPVVQVRGPSAWEPRAPVDIEDGSL